MPTHVGVAGWSIPAMLADRFPAAGTHLERYGARLLAVEINTSFYRPHRRATYERWAASVPAAFRFAVKLPKTITHGCRLVNCHDLMERFAGETAGLGRKRGPILVQLPPSLAWPGDLAERFFCDLKAMIDGPIVVEPRHASWFAPQVDAMLVRQRISRVAADPARMAGQGGPAAGWRWPISACMARRACTNHPIRKNPSQRRHRPWWRLNGAGRMSGRYTTIPPSVPQHATRWNWQTLLAWMVAARITDARGRPAPCAAIRAR